MDIFLQLGYTSIYVLLWGCACVNLQKHTRYSWEQVTNFVSAYHCLGCIGLGLWYTFVSPTLNTIYALMGWSQGYYIYDLTNHSTSSIFFAHHLGAICVEQYLLLLADPLNLLGQAALWSLFWAEVSNLPVYVIYHYEQQNRIEAYGNRPLTRWNKRYWYTMEAWMFLGLRNLVGIWYLILKPITDSVLWYLGLGTWLGSLWWGHAAYDKLVNLE